MGPKSEEENEDDFLEEDHAMNTGGQQSGENTTKPIVESGEEVDPTKKSCEGVSRKKEREDRS